MRKRNVYRCECGNRLQVRQVVKNDVTTCPACARVLPKKLIMQCYYNRRRTRTRQEEQSAVSDGHRQVAVSEVRSSTF